MHEYTVRALMNKTDLTYNNTYSLIKRMRNKGFIQEVKKTRQVGAATNAKKYGLMMDPIEFLRVELEQNPSPPPPAAFFNNPFNLGSTPNLVLQKWKSGEY